MLAVSGEEQRERERGNALVLLLLFIVHHSAELSGGTLGKSQMNPLIEPPAPDIYSLQLLSLCVFVPCLSESVTAPVSLCTCCRVSSFHVNVYYP